jgi:isopenicillin N synthase-like dioxygenase
MTRARYSIVYFISPDSDTTIECLAECANESNPAKYGPISQREYRLMRGKLQYRETAPKVTTIAG